jgi:hypothetical protein
MTSKDIMEVGKTALTKGMELLLSRPEIQKTLGEIESEIDREKQISSAFTRLSADLLEKTFLADNIANQILYYDGGHIPRSIFEEMSKRTNSSIGAARIESAASNFLTAHLIKTHSKEILKIAREEVEKARAAHADFCRDNAKTLAKLELI